MHYNPKTTGLEDSFGFINREEKMKLVIAEKPSVAKNIADAIGANHRNDGYFEGSGYFVSWCVGHLVTLADASSYSESYKKWRKEDLPIIPGTWKYEILQNSSDRFNALKKLMFRNDVESLVEATDAGREGELIFRLVYMMAGCKKPVERLWLSSMESAAIIKAFANFKSSREYDNLYASALCRSQADWLVGINMTRLFSILHGTLLNVGRVVTPTLSLIVERRNEISNFKVKKFYTVGIDCGFTATSRRFDLKEDAEKLASSVAGQRARVVSFEKTQKAISAPRPFDLTSLQRTANKLFGYTAQQVLDTVQSLYEKKLVTYPRTDSSFLTSDMKNSLPGMLEVANKFVSKVTKEQGIDYPDPKTADYDRIIDDKKVSDHHAIIPTNEICKMDFSKFQELSSLEKDMLLLISVRLLESLSSSASVIEFKIILSAKGEEFTCSGKTIVHQGWKNLEKLILKNVKDKTDEESDQKLPIVQKDAELKILDQEVKEGETTPPKQFTEDTLLSAMEHASAKEFAEIKDVERKGLGTPATRASIIEKLVKGGFVERKGRSLVATEKGVQLVSYMPERIKSSKLTADWEAKLKDVELGKLPAGTFMEEIKAYVKDITDEHAGDVPQNNNEKENSSAIVGKCPLCGSSVVETKKGYSCNCGFMIWKESKFFKAKRKNLTSSLATKLLADKKVWVTGLYSENKHSKYDAYVVMDLPEDQNGKGLKFASFHLEFDDSSKKQMHKGSTGMQSSERKVRHR